MHSQTSEKSSAIRLHYFGINGRAASIRAILHSQNVQFDDVKYTFESWANVKKSGDFEFEQMPMLEIDGNKLSQTYAICLYLARNYNLLGSSLYEEYMINSLVCSFDDIHPSVLEIMFPKTDEQKANIATNTKNFLTTKAPFFMKIWEARYNTNGTNYMVGKGFTLADIFIAVNLYLLFKHPSRIATWESVLNENAPNLSKLVDRISQNELASYFKHGFIAESAF
jgi:glutathione S-transferase